jgi:hypothetical protein
MKTLQAKDCGGRIWLRSDWILGWVLAFGFSGCASVPSEQIATPVAATPSVEAEKQPGVEQAQLADLKSQVAGLQEKVVQQQATIAQQSGVIEEQTLALAQLREISRMLSNSLRPAAGVRDSDVAEAIMKNLRRLDQGLERYCRAQGVAEATIADLFYSNSVEVPFNLVEGESYAELRLSVAEPEWTVKTPSGITVTLKREVKDPASFVKAPAGPAVWKMVAPPVETVGFTLEIKYLKSGRWSRLNEGGPSGEAITIINDFLPYKLVVTAAKPYAESGTKVTIETWELIETGETEFVNRVTLTIVRGEQPSFEVAGRKAEPIRVTVANFGRVVSTQERVRSEPPKP